MKYEFRRMLMSESYDARLRVFVDPDATKFDAATVTILDTEMTVHSVGDEVWSYERLMAECQRIASMMRAPLSGFAPPAPYPGHLIPFAEILLTDRDRIAACTRLLVTAGVIGHADEDDHTYAQRTARDAHRAMERVEALGEAVDLLAFLERKKKRAAI